MAGLQPALPFVPRSTAFAPATPATPRPAAATGALWCAIVLPRLVLEVRPLAKARPLAVFDPGRRMILAANPAAAAAGVHPGQSTTTAWARCPALVACIRDPAAEAGALERLAGWAAQFSPRITRETEGVVLEIGASLSLFGGLAALVGRLETGLAALGYTAECACAPTPLAALWLARAGRSKPVIAMDRIAGALAPLPLATMGLGETTRKALAGLGLECIGELMRLPRAGLARRYRPELVAALDRALGRLPDPRPAWSAAPRYAGGLELAVETESLEFIRHALARLTEELAGFLRAREACVRALDLVLETERQVLETTISCHAPLDDSGRMLELLATRLEAFTLPAPVRRVALEAKDFTSRRPERPLPGETMPLAPVLARLAARLGEAAAVRLSPAPDPRPERATRSAHPGEAPGRPGAPRSGWPLLLLAEPRPLPEIAGLPCLDGRLEPLEGPERIESGWWDGGDVARDYYCMRARNGARLWVFHDRKRRGWYLHGYFA